MISEIGILSYFIIHKEKGIIDQDVGGYLLRTKSESSNEGGVVTGYSSMDSLIIDNIKWTIMKHIFNNSKLIIINNN